MATKDSTSAVPSKLTMISTGEESVTPVFQLSSLGELSTSMVAETNRRLEVIQRAQVSSLVGADKGKEPQKKIPKKLSPTLATRPKKYALEMWVEIETSPGVYSTSRMTPTALILQLTLSIMPIPVVLACTWTWLAICWPSMERRPTLGQASSMIKVSWPVKLSLTFLAGWGTLLSRGCNV